MKFLRILAWALLGGAVAGAITLALPVRPWRTGELPLPALVFEPVNEPAPTQRRRIWIDADAACGESARARAAGCATGSTRSAATDSVRSA